MEDLDDQLEVEAAAIGASKAALIRESVARRYQANRPTIDPIAQLIGAFDGDEVSSIDDVVNGVT